MVAVELQEALTYSLSSTYTVISRDGETHSEYFPVFCVGALFLCLVFTELITKRLNLV